jgi:hypothetical protein
MGCERAHDLDGRFTFEPIEVRFWRLARRRAANECWPWTGTKTPKGYGTITEDGRDRRAPQVAWEIANHQPFPRGKIACHSCDNPSCVNPAHIWPGTYAENIRDMVSKGRSAGQRKTHCANGHEFTSENTYCRPGRAHRLCRTCNRQSSLASYYRRIAKARGEA